MLQHLIVNEETSGESRLERSQEAGLTSGVAALDI